MSDSDDEVVPVLLSRGTVVVPDAAYGRSREAAQDMDVLPVSEALRDYDEED